MVNQLGSYLPNIITTMTSLSAMTSYHVQWVWLPIHTDEFNKAKEIYSNAISLTTFDFNCQTSIETDTSKVGIAYMLKQTDNKGKNYIINIGSTSLKLKHSLLAPTDLECIGMIFAIKKLDYYIRGCPKVELVTDCKGIATTIEKDFGEIKKTMPPEVVIKYQLYDQTHSREIPKNSRLSKQGPITNY
jgi:hypothetical protein